MSTLGLRITDNLNARLKEVAAITNRSKSQVAKIAINYVTSTLLRSVGESVIEFKDLLHP